MAAGNPTRRPAQPIDVGAERGIRKSSAGAVVAEVVREWQPRHSAARALRVTRGRSSASAGPGQGPFVGWLGLELSTHGPLREGDTAEGGARSDAGRGDPGPVQRPSAGVVIHVVALEASGASVGVVGPRWDRQQRLHVRPPAQRILLMEDLRLSDSATAQPYRRKAWTGPSAGGWHPCRAASKGPGRTSVLGMLGVLGRGRAAGGEHRLAVVRMYGGPIPSRHAP